MPGVDALDVYKQFGVAALFIVMYTTTVWFLIRVLLQDKKALTETITREAQRSEAMAKIIQENAMCAKQVADTLKDLADTLESEAQTNRELMTYLRTRDQFKDKER